MLCMNKSIVGFLLAISFSAFAENEIFNHQLLQPGQYTQDFKYQVVENITIESAIGVGCVDKNPYAPVRIKLPKGIENKLTLIGVGESMFHNGRLAVCDKPLE